MNVDFWHQKWKKGEIGFHADIPNPLLIAHFSVLNIRDGNRVFLPLCGKTLDIKWLLSKGYRVVGAELSQLAIEQLFNELDLEPNITKRGKLLHYQAKSLDIFVGDIFDLSKDEVGVVDAIYDRAAFVALPADMRKRYSKHLLAITAKAKQLLITFEYDQSVIAGPPFSISSAEVNGHYMEAYSLSLLESKPLGGGLKGVCPAMEHIWFLHHE
jgi:thiopurine S-methyltransferase